MPLSFEDFMLLKMRYSPVTVKERLKSLRNAEEHGFRAEAADADACRSYLARLLGEGRGDNAFNHHLKALRALLLWRGEELGLSTRPQPESRFKFLSQDQDTALLRYKHLVPAVSRLRRAALLWCRMSAMRRSEIVAMELEDLDHIEHRFYIRRPAKRGPKRWLPIEPWVLSPKRALGAYLAHRPSPPDDPTALWVSQHHGSQGPTKPRRLTPAGLGRLLQHSGRELGFRVNTNITRHSRLTELRRLGWDLTSVQYYAGHRRVTSTQIYAGVTPADVQDLMGRHGSADPFHRKRSH